MAASSPAGADAGAGAGAGGPLSARQATAAVLAWLRMATGVVLHPETVRAAKFDRAGPDDTRVLLGAAQAHLTKPTQGLLSALLAVTALRELRLRWAASRGAASAHVRLSCGGRSGAAMLASADLRDFVAGVWDGGGASGCIAAARGLGAWLPQHASGPPPGGRAGVQAVPPLGPRAALLAVGAALASPAIDPFGEFVELLLQCGHRALSRSPGPPLSTARAAAVSQPRSVETRVNQLLALRGRVVATANTCTLMQRALWRQRGAVADALVRLSAAPIAPDEVAALAEKQRLGRAPLLSERGSTMKAWLADAALVPLLAQLEEVWWQWMDSVATHGSEDDVDALGGADQELGAACELPVDSTSNLANELELRRLAFAALGEGVSAGPAPVVQRSDGRELAHELERLRPEGLRHAVVLPARQLRHRLRQARATLRAKAAAAPDERALAE
jgi:hypothetical protein